MAEDESLNLDDNGGDAPAAAAPAKKGKGIGALLPALLKWVAIGVGAVILIVTVVIITMKIVGGNSTQQVAVPVSEEYDNHKEVLDWYSSLGVMRTQTSDEPPSNVSVEVVLGYKKDDKATSTEISQRTVELKDFLRRYFSSKKAQELKNTSNEDSLTNEIKNGINDQILSSSRIRDVKFLQKDVIEQN